MVSAHVADNEVRQCHTGRRWWSACSKNAAGYGPLEAGGRAAVHIMGRDGDLLPARRGGVGSNADIYQLQRGAARHRGAGGHPLERQGGGTLFPWQHRWAVLCCLVHHLFIKIVGFWIFGSEMDSQQKEPPDAPPFKMTYFCTLLLKVGYFFLSKQGLLEQNWVVFESCRVTGVI